MSNLADKYKKEVRSALQKKLDLKNPMMIPALKKIVVSMGVQNAMADKKNMEKMAEVMAEITGQKAKVTRAKKSIATFKLRENDAIGLMVTLRGKRMYDFYGKLVNIVMPRIRDFHGINRKGFDGHGNFSLGFSEFTVFPEIDPGKIDRVQGLQISIITSAGNDEKGFAFFEAMGMPFEKIESKKSKSNI